MQAKHENEVKDSRKRHDTAMAETQAKLSQTTEQLQNSEETRRNLDSELRDTKQ